MTLEKYLELMYSVYENFYDRIDYYYKEASFVTNVRGNVPIKYMLDKGELKILVKKTVYSYYDEETKSAYISLGLYKPLLSNNYMVEGMVVYPLNNDVVKEALEYVEEYKELFKNLYERKSFYSGDYRVTIESYEFSKEKENRTMEITLNYGNYKTAHLYVDLDKRHLETVDTFNESYLKEIIIPEELIPDVIKNLSLSNNFPIEPLTDAERTIHMWHPKPVENKPKERSRRPWSRIFF